MCLKVLKPVWKLALAKVTQMITEFHREEAVDWYFYDPVFIITILIEGMI